MEIGPITASTFPQPVSDLAVGQGQPNERREIVQAVKAINAAELFGENNEVTFVLDRQTRRPLLRIVDRKTKEVLRQIPSEHVLRMAEGLKTQK